MKTKLLAVAAVAVVGLVATSQTASAQVFVGGPPVVVNKTVVVKNGFVGPGWGGGFVHPRPVFVAQPAFGVPVRPAFYGPAIHPGFGWGNGFGYGWGPQPFGTTVGFGVVRPGFGFGVFKTFP